MRFVYGPMRNALAILAIGIFANLGYAAPPFTHMQTGISLPDTIAGLTRGDTKRYEVVSGESTVAIPYHSEEVEVTVFIRRIDPQKITSPKMIVEETLATVKQLEATGTYSNVKLYEFADDVGMPRWSKGGFSARIDQDAVISLVYATIRGDYAVKARLTTANPRNDSLQKFVAEFQKIVNAAKPSP
jgi:hypothetical protein